MKDEKKIVILHETVLQSWACDLGTLVMLVALCGIGRALGVSALEWVGGVMSILWLFAQPSKRKMVMTYAELRAYLDRIEGRQ